MEKKKAGKKRLVLFLLLTVLIVTGWFWLRPLNPTSAELNKRTNEFIQEQRQLGNQDFTNVDLYNNERSGQSDGNKTIVIKKCFSFFLPFAINLQKKMGECWQWYSIDSSRGQITIYLRPTDLQSLDQDSGVQMRRVYKDQYQESSQTFNNNNWLVFNKKGQQYEVTAFNLRQGRLFVLNLLSTNSDNLDKQFDQMLESVKFLDKQ